MFQFLDGTPEKTWLIKAPEHMGYLDLVFETFPEAPVVQTHRDPVTAITSIAVLTAASRRTDNPQHKHGRHRYDIATVGLTEDQVRAAFSDYLERFGDLI